MAVVPIRVSDDFKLRLKVRAGGLGRSVSEHVRCVLADDMGVVFHHGGFTERRRRRKRRGRISPVLWVPLTIHRGDEDWDVEVEVVDFYIRRHSRFTKRLCSAADDVNEVHFASEGVVEETGERFVLTENEILRAEEKFWRMLEHGGGGE